MKVERLVREDNLDILLSEEEHKACRQHIKPVGYVWWLRSPGGSRWTAADVDYYGYVSSYGVHVSRNCLAVRPALQITNPESANLKIGDSFYLFDYTWTVISEGLALCDKSIA